VIFGRGTQASQKEARRAQKAAARAAKAQAKAAKKSGGQATPEGAAQDVASPLLPGQYEFSPRLLPLSAPRAAAALAVRRNATEILSHHIDLGRRGLVICGAASGAGVTFTAANLAVSLADMGVSTLLIDANLRRPGLEDYIRPGGAGPGLQQHLRAPGHLERILHAEVLPNLSLIYSGGPAEDAQELLTSPTFRSLLSECMRNYDCTLLDTPATNRAADALLAGNAVAYALIVARRGVTYAEDIETLRLELAKDHVTVVGAILNGA